MFLDVLSADLYIIDIPSSCTRILLVPSFPSPNGGVVPATPLQQWNALQQSHVSVTMSEALLQKATIEQVMLVALKCCGQEDAMDSAEPLFLTFLMQECVFFREYLTFKVESHFTFRFRLTPEPLSVCQWSIGTFLK